MLYDHDSFIFLNLPDQFNCIINLLFRHPGGGLIQHYQVRIRGQDPNQGDNILKQM